MIFASVWAVAAAVIPAAAVQAQAAGETLFQDVRIFDGKGEELSAPTSVLVRGNLIAAIGDDLTAAPEAAVIDGGGRTLMPGLIDAHWHTMLIRQTPEQMMFGDEGLTY